MRGASHGRRGSGWCGVRRSCRFPESLQGTEGSSSASEGGLPAGRNPALVPARRAGRRGDDHRHRPVWSHEARPTAPLSPIRPRHAGARPPRRHPRRAGRPTVPALLCGLGGGVDRHPRGRYRDRRQDGAPVRPEAEGSGADPPGLRLRRPPAPRPRPGQGGGEVQRDHGHPQAAGVARHRRRDRHHRRHGLPARDRPKDP